LDEEGIEEGIEEVMATNEQWREKSPEEEMLLANVMKPDDLHPGKWYSATDVLNELNMRTSLNLYAYGVTRLGMLLSKLGYERQRFHDGYKYLLYIKSIEQVEAERQNPR
jgi:hypothetical protein